MLHDARLRRITMNKRFLFLIVFVSLSNVQMANANGNTPPVVTFAPQDVNVLQDCWTKSDSQELEEELYRFDPNYPGGGVISFVWKHKILEDCSNYCYRIDIYNECLDGKNIVELTNSPIENCKGLVLADSNEPEQIFTHQIQGITAAGYADWILTVECIDTSQLPNGSVEVDDGDIEDQCGANFSTVKTPDAPTGLILYGPEPPGPLPALSPLAYDKDPGGSPLGRLPGESGETRPWCFEVLPDTEG